MCTQDEIEQEKQKGSLLEKDLVNVAGWGGSYEFVRDAWTRGSKGRFFPQPRKIKGEHKITQRGAK